MVKSMTSLQEIIERLTVAAGPDREIDADIWLATRVGWVRQRYNNWLGLQSRGSDAAERQYALLYAPTFSASLDAALSLVPEGYVWRACEQLHYRGDGWKDENGRMRSWAQVDPARSPVNIDQIHEAEALTTPLALCIAALKARQS